MNHYNSNIRIKYGQCIDCLKTNPHTPPKALTAGRCKFHYKVYRNDHLKKLTKEREGRREKALSLAALESSMGIEKTQGTMILWYGNIMLNEPPVCWNCNKQYEWVKNPHYKSLWHSAVAHILPKYLFKSVKNHELNYLILFAGYGGTMCGCHDQYDQYMDNKDWEKLLTMKVWPVALERFRIIEPLIAPEERRHIPEIFML